MLLAQINRDSQGMTEFPGGGMEAQHVTLCLTEAVTVAGEQNCLKGPCGFGNIYLKGKWKKCNYFVPPPLAKGNTKLSLFMSVFTLVWMLGAVGHGNIFL